MSDGQDQQRAAHGRALTKLVSLFKDLQVDVLTKWRDAHRRLLDSTEYKSDKELQDLPNLDLLLAFEDYSRVQEREYEEQTRRTAMEKARKDRKAREAFKVALSLLGSYILGLIAVIGTTPRARRQRCHSRTDEVEADLPRVLRRPTVPRYARNTRLESARAVLGRGRCARSEAGCEGGRRQ